MTLEKICYLMCANSIDTKTASERSRAEGESESTYAQPADFLW